MDYWARLTHFGVCGSVSPTEIDQLQRFWDGEEELKQYPNQSLKLVSSLRKKVGSLFLVCSDSCYHGEQMFEYSKLLYSLAAPKVSIPVHQDSFTDSSLSLHNPLPPCLRYGGSSFPLETWDCIVDECMKLKSVRPGFVQAIGVIFSGYEKNWGRLPFGINLFVYKL